MVSRRTTELTGNYIVKKMGVRAPKVCIGRAGTRHGQIILTLPSQYLFAGWPWGSGCTWNIIIARAIVRHPVAISHLKYENHDSTVNQQWSTGKVRQWPGNHNLKIHF